MRRLCRRCAYHQCSTRAVISGSARRSASLPSPAMRSCACALALWAGIHTRSSSSPSCTTSCGSRSTKDFPIDGVPPAPPNPCGPPVRTASASQHELVVDERRSLVNDTTALDKTAFCVKTPGACRCIPGVETNRIRRPLRCDVDRIGKREPTESLPLVRDRNCHAGQIQWTLHRREVRDIDGPRLLRCQPEHREDFLADAP